MKNSLHVNVKNSFVGKISVEKSQYIFAYSDEAQDFVSLTMPLRVAQYKNDRLHPIFEMHLPEGYLLSIIKKHFSKLVKTDDFGLLQLMSESINTRLTYGSTHKKKNSLELQELLYPKSQNLFEELVSRFALQSPLSGVQPKVLASVKNRATLKYDDYIVKSWGEEYPELALNEYYCMKLVQYSNLEVPEFYLSSDEKLFIMKRFDILSNGEKLGFEDMCVLQAKKSDDKYEGSYEKIAKTIKVFTSTQHKKNALKQFFKMIVINNIVQNGDAHLKNFGLIYRDIHEIKMAPAYDVVSTTAYIKSDIPALHLLGSKKWWSKKYLLRFGMESCELTNKEALSLYNEVIEATKQVLQELHQKVSKEKKEEKKTLLNHLITTFTDGIK